MMLNFLRKKFLPPPSFSLSGQVGAEQVDGHLSAVKS